MNLNISFNIKCEGEPIIFIHGIGSRKTTWDGVIEELKIKGIIVALVN